MKKWKDNNGLESIPGIGESLAADLRLIGIKNISDLKGEYPERLYRKLEKKIGTHQDRCVLYTFRCAVYFASKKKHDPELLKWWNWSDKNLGKSQSKQIKTK